MATKEQTPKKAATERTILTKIAGKVGYIAGGIAGGKDHLIEMAGEAIESVKSTIQEMTSGKKTAKKVAPKKTAPRAAVKAPAKKAAAPAKRTTAVSATNKAAAPGKEGCQISASKSTGCSKKNCQETSQKSSS